MMQVNEGRFPFSLAQKQPSHPDPLYFASDYPGTTE